MILEMPQPLKLPMGTGFHAYLFRLRTDFWLKHHRSHNRGYKIYTKLGEELLDPSRSTAKKMIIKLRD